MKAVKLVFFEKNEKQKEVINYHKTRKKRDEDFNNARRYLCTSKKWLISEIYEGYISAYHKNKTTSVQIKIIK